MNVPGHPVDASRAEPRPSVEVDISLTVGEMTVHAAFSTVPGITALFGPSGAGKSLTLGAIAGLLRPQSGRIRLHGNVVADADAGVHVRTQDRRLGVVFQHAALLPHRSPVDNVAIAVRDERDRQARRRHALAWLERVHAGHLASTPTRSLSGGEQQRVALGRALAGDPRVLLLDEPFSALDLPTRRSLRDLLRELVDREHLTALLVTHDLDDVVHLADRVVLYEPGRTVAIHELAPHSPEHVARLLGLAG